ncbi:AfsR/SARP family transcriptional regulator [Actinophytocola sp.]|uniref:AfsR/SARP family transcriptional regulator n=1 Tax=Actinophytocola sp. TaxID=1872138 RepID=UPI002ECFF01B
MAEVLHDTVDFTFRILGPLEVDGPSGPVRVPPGRQQVILALLLFEANRVVSIEHIIDALWEDEPPDTARTQVQICMSRLRKNLASGGVDVGIDTRPPGYRLRVPDEWLDAHAFNQKVAEARVLAKEGRASEAAGLLRTAVSLWGGPCLSGMPNRALRTRAMRLDEEKLNATEDYLDLDLRQGGHHQLVGEITRLVHENPLRERLRALLMTALHRSGRQAEALEVYRAGRALLIDELGLEPGPELRMLETAILSGDNELLGGTTKAPATRAVPEAPQPPRVERPRQLPADTADFVGQENLIRTAESVLTGGEKNRAIGVVVVVGRPGVGKSTVATHIGHLVAQEHFSDGQLYCDLRGTRSEPSSAIDVLGRFLLALGIPGPMIPDGLDGRVEMYRTVLAERRVIVVLDDAVSEQQVLPLLPGSPTCAVLITSRTRLTGVPGARQIEVDVLGVDHSLELLGRVIGTGRVNREPESAAALVRTVGGLPLALRIIAARLAARPHWSLASMVHRLASERRRLDELAHGEMTIRASLSLTHDGLDHTSRRLFGLLSLAEGSTLPGWLAGAVLDDDHPFPSDLLEPLVDVHMLEVTAVEKTGEFRYRLQDMVRLFARERLAAEVDPAAHADAVERMIGGWLALAERAHRRVYGGDYAVLHGTGRRWLPPDGYVDELLAEPLDWMAGEQANLCGAVAQAAQLGLHELCWDLAVTTATLCESRGYLADWQRTHDNALVATRAAGNTRGTAALLGSLGTLYIHRGQWDRSRHTLTEALALFVELDDPRGLGLCRRDLALLSRYADDYERALSLYQQALDDFARVEDVVGRASVLTQRAHILAMRGESVRANNELSEAMDIYRTVGYMGGMAHALRRIGQLQTQSGEHERAVRTLTEVLEMVRRSGDVIGEGHLLCNLGEVSVAAGREEAALGYFELALAAREGIMDQAGAARARLELATLLLRRAEPARATALLEQAIDTFTAWGMERERAVAEDTLGTITGTAR